MPPENFHGRDAKPAANETSRTCSEKGNTTSELPVIQAQHRGDSRLRVDHRAGSDASIGGGPIIKGPAHFPLIGRIPRRVWYKPRARGRKLLGRRRVLPWRF